MKKNDRKPIVLRPNQGRIYEMGAIRSIFKADGKETSNRYSISEWWVEPRHAGPGKHSHDEDDIFFVIEGTMSIWLKDKWIEAPKGSFVLVPSGIEHDFENRSDSLAGMLNLSVPGGFEDHMPSIVEWFEVNPSKHL